MIDQILSMKEEKLKVKERKKTYGQICDEEENIVFEIEGK